MIPNSNKSRGARRRVTQNKTPANGARGSAFPMQLPASIQIDKVIRFKASSALASAPVTATDVQDLLCVATGTTAAYRLSSAFKLRKIEAWAPPASDGSATILAVEDAVISSSFTAPSRRIEDVTMGQSRPAHVMWKPQADSLLGKWLQSTVGLSSLVELTGPAGTTFDVHLSLMLQDGEAPQAVTAAVAGATVGTLYIRSLNSNGSNNIPPVSYSTI